MKQGLINDDHCHQWCTLSFGQPSRILHADGYVDVSGQMPVFYYHLKDHLGNVRSVITPGTGNQPEIVQAMEYFPFGMSFESSIPYESEQAFLPNKHKYNSNEEQEMPGKWLDYGFRFYDAQIARFHSVDPLAHSFSSQSPYVYAGNNPILNIDFMGLSILNYAMNLKGRSASDVELTNEQWMASTRPDANPSSQGQFIMQNRHDYFNNRQIEAALNNPLQLQNLGYSGYYTLDNNGYIVKHYIDGIGAFYWSRSAQSGGGVDWSGIGNTLTAGGVAYYSLEKSINNSKYWVDAKGGIRSTEPPAKRQLYCRFEHD